MYLKCILSLQRYENHVKLQFSDILYANLLQFKIEY